MAIFLGKEKRFVLCIIISILIILSLPIRYYIPTVTFSPQSKMTFAEGALIWIEGDVSIRLELQEDGLLRATLTAPGTGMTLYLLPQYVEGVSLNVEP